MGFMWGFLPRRSQRIICLGWMPTWGFLRDFGGGILPRRSQRIII